MKEHRKTGRWSAGKGGWVLVCIACALIGLIATLAVRGVRLPGSSALAQRSQDLSARVQQLTQDNGWMQERIDELELRLRNYEESAESTDMVAQNLRKDLLSARMSAGLVDVRGPGVLVEIDLRYVIGATGTYAARDVLDEDLLLIVNELNAAGAEAIAVNGQRLAATSEIRRAGSLININTQPVSVPFRIEAVGDPDTLWSAMNLYGGVLDLLGDFYTITVTRVELLALPRFTGNTMWRYATPVQETP